MRSSFACVALAIIILLGVSGCGSEAGNAQQETVQMTSSQEAGKSNSPADKFSTLDEYLAHLKKLGAQDYPFYERAGPDRYKLNVGRGGNRQPAQYFTRDELMKKFGFSR